MLSIPDIDEVGMLWLKESIFFAKLEQICWTREGSVKKLSSYHVLFVIPWISQWCAKAIVSWKGDAPCSKGSLHFLRVFFFFFWSVISFFHSLPLFLSDFLQEKRNDRLRISASFWQNPHNQHHQNTKTQDPCKELCQEIWKYWRINFFPSQRNRKGKTVFFLSFSFFHTFPQHCLAFHSLLPSLSRIQIRSPDICFLFFSSFFFFFFFPIASRHGWHCGYPSLQFFPLFLLPIRLNILQWCWVNK